MVHNFKNNLRIVICSIAFLLPTAAQCLIIPRSQSVNAARELVGTQKFINRADQENTYGVFFVTAEYQQSFKTAQLMQCLFPNNVSVCDNVASLPVQGSCVTNRLPNAWLADYFGLPTDFNSIVHFKPKIRTGILDFNLYLGLDEWAQGLFFKVQAPLVWTQWNVCAFEQIITGGTTTFEPGYMGVTGTTPDWQGVTPTRHRFLSAVDGTYTFGDMQTPLAYGVFCENGNDACKKNLVRFSDIDLVLGYNGFLNDDYHLGLELRFSIPAGNKPCNICVFEPIVGNGKYATLGAGLTAHRVLWTDCTCPDTTLSWYLDAHISHLFDSCQKRSFDIADKPNSRYMLVEQFGTPTTADTSGGALFYQETFAVNTASTPVATQYDGNLLPLINISTLNVSSSFKVQGDIVFKLSYMTPNWDIDLGYEFWGRSAEKLCLRADVFSEKTYALKGDAYIYGFGASDAVSQPDAAIRLSATESNSTINNGTNFGTAGVDCSDDTAFLLAQRNLNIDSRVDAVTANPTAAGPAQDRIVATPNTPGTDDVQQGTSSTPVFITISDFALSDCPATSAMTHKVFANIAYNWNCNCLFPFIGIGGEAEFAPYSCKKGCTNTNTNCAISQWGVWLKGGLGF